MDERAQLRGMERIELAKAAFRGLQAVVSSLPAAFHGTDHGSRGTNLLVGLCGPGMDSVFQKLRDAVAATKENSHELVLHYRWPDEDGTVVDAKQAVQLAPFQVTQHQQKIEQVLATLCTDLEKYDRAIRLADELAGAAEACPPNPSFHGHRIRFDSQSFHNAKRDYMEHASRKLAEATRGLAMDAANALRRLALDEPRGILTLLANRWAAVPLPPPERSSGTPAVAETQTVREIAKTANVGFQVSEGNRVGTYILNVPDKDEPVSITKGVAKLLRLLSSGGVAKQVLYSTCQDLEKAVPNLPTFGYKRGKKVGNYVISVSATGLVGQVQFDPKCLTLLGADDVR